MSKDKTPAVVAVCASISFYEKVIMIKTQLEKNGVKVLAPELAEIMALNNDFRLESYMESWFKGDFLAKKSEAMRDHFEKIAQADAVLIINSDKHGNRAYIGPNVLMEMGLAFYLKKGIFIWRKIEDNDRFREEILAMRPVWIEEKIEKIKI